MAGSRRFMLGLARSILARRVFSPSLLNSPARIRRNRSGSLPGCGPATGTGGWACRRRCRGTLAHLVAGQVIDVGLAPPEDELLGVLVALVKVVAAVEDAAVGVGTQPMQILDDAVDVLLAFAGGVGVVQTQVELAAVLVRDGPVDVDGLGAANVQVAVRPGGNGYGSR